MFGKKKERDPSSRAGADGFIRDPGRPRDLGRDTMREPERGEAREMMPDLSTPRSPLARTELSATPPAIARPPLPEAPPARRLPPEIATAARRSDNRSNPGETEGKRLIVGRDIVLTGEIRACQKLVVEGRVEASLSESRSIEISETGIFKGSAAIETADISGRFEGDITVYGRLSVRSTGRIIGSIRYAQIEVEKGGILSGQVDVLELNEIPAGADLRPAPQMLEPIEEMDDEPL